MDISLVIYHSHLHSHSPQPLLELRKDCLCRSNSGNPGILLYGNRNDFIVFCDDYVALESNNILISILGRVKSTERDSRVNDHLGTRRTEQGGRVEDQSESAGERAFVVCEESDSCSNNMSL